jgi:D-alanyl-D-alanine carboxypeptidase
MSRSEPARFVRDYPCEFPPRSRYQSLGHTDNILVALLAEAATDRRYERLLAEDLQAGAAAPDQPPANCRDARALPPGNAVAPERVREDVSEAMNPSGAWASGGIVSMPEEVGRSFRAYVSGRLYDAATRRLRLRFTRGSSSPPAPGCNAAGRGLLRYRTRCGTAYVHTGSFAGYLLVAASGGNGRRSVVFSVNAEILPGHGSPQVPGLIQRARPLAVCRALR